MGRVFLGAIIGAIIGGLLGSLAKNLDASFQLNHPGPAGGWQVVSLAKLVGALAIIIGAGSGGIIGAIAGAVSARPETRPVPVWFWYLLLGLVVLLGVVGALLLVMVNRTAVKVDPQDRPGLPNIQKAAEPQINPPPKIDPPPEPPAPKQP